WGLEAAQRQLAAQLSRPERADEEFDRLVTASVAASAELLEQDLGRVPNLGRPSAQISRMRSQQPIASRWALVRPPARLAHAAPDRLTIQPEPARQFRDRYPLVYGQTSQLLPALPTDHRHLLG